MNIVEKILNIKDNLAGLLDGLEVASLDEDHLDETEKMIIDDLDDIQELYFELETKTKKPQGEDTI